MQWHLYCRVVDNFGDVGVAWRLAADLAARGERIRLFIDDASALAWMAPGGAEGVEVFDWNDPWPAPPAVVAELFGGGLPRSCDDDAATSGRPPVRINVEHLSAEAWVERSHGLPSPRRCPDGTSATTWYFYPGFGEGTGGLIREAGIPQARDHDGGTAALLAALGIEPRPGERRVLVFCYDNGAFDAMLDGLATEPTLLLAAPGAAAAQVAASLGPARTRGGLRAVDLPFVTQTDFDRLLAACDLAFVRGEDSFVRAIWAGVPFVWQLYPQDDGAHAAKLAAFLDRFLAGAPTPLVLAVRAVFARWNGIGPHGAPIAGLDGATLQEWRRHCLSWRDVLAIQDDLATQLIAFVTARR